MIQLELPLEGPEPISKYLHVWTEAERARRIKKPRDEAQGEGPENRAEGDGRQAACQRKPSGVLR